jgi:hypothetical protein
MDRHRTATLIAAAALLLGIAGDTLLRWIPLGVNVLLWTALFVIGARVCSERTNWFAAACALLAASGLLWRDCEPLIALDVLLLLLFLPMLALGGRGVRVAAAGVSEIAGAIAVTAVQSVAGLPQLIATDLSWSRAPRVRFRGLGVAARGTFIAAPALVIFGVLLANADPAFERLLHDLFVFDISEALQHLIVTAVIAAICAGFLRSLALSGAMPTVTRPELLALPTPEVNFALGLVNLLFALFIGVQFRYFFGAAPAELAEYARRGFFELAWVVALVVPMLLALEWLVRKERGYRLFRIMAALQVALVFVIAASAFHRMQLYRAAYGLTRLRVFTTAFMIWVALLLIWLVCTVLTGRRQRFAIGALASGMAMVVLLHAVNPDAMIVATNIERARMGRRAFDSEHAITLSDDAAEVIMANAGAFTPVQLQRFVTRKRYVGWRTWNVSRARARRAVGVRSTVLSRAVGVATAGK